LKRRLHIFGEYLNFYPSADLKRLINIKCLSIILLKYFQKLQRWFGGLHGQESTLIQNQDVHIEAYIDSIFFVQKIKLHAQKSPPPKKNIEFLTSLTSAF